METFIKMAEDILSKVIYITLATASKYGAPWNSPLYAVHDENYVFYWVSSPMSQHSRNIVENDNVFIVVYDSTVKEGTGYGIYVAARASEVTDEGEIGRASEMLHKRKGESVKPVSDYTGTMPRRVYKAVPEKFWLNTDAEVGGHHVDARITIELIPVPAPAVQTEKPTEEEEVS